MDSNAVSPFLGRQLPLYPPPLQLLRVTAATVLGPTGGTSAGIGTGDTAPKLLYISSTQQLRTDTLGPRDREPCLVLDVNNVGLIPGYYLGRLSNSYQPPMALDPNRGVFAPQSYLPVYEVTVFGVGGTTTSPGFLPGVTADQVNMLNASLTPSSIPNLNNLTACQLQVLLKLPVVNIQLLSNLSPMAVQNILDGLTYEQVLPVVTQLTQAQVTALSNTYPQLYQSINQLLTPAQALSILSNATQPQLATLVSLTPTQLLVVGQLSVPERQVLTGLTREQVTTLVGQLTQPQLSSLLTILTLPQIQTLTNTFTSSQIQSVLQGVTFAQLSTLLSNLSQTNLLTLSNYNSVTTKILVTGLSTANLIALLNTTPAPTNPVVTSYVQTLPTSTPQNNVVVTGNVILVPTVAPTTITGLVPFDTTVTQTVTIVNTGVSAITVANLSGSSSTNNQFSTSTGASLTIAPSGGSVTFTYTPSMTKWLDTAISTSGASGGGSVTGSGTTGKLVIWTGSTVLGDGPLSYNSGTTVLSTSAIITISTGFGSVTIDASNSPTSIAGSGDLQISAVGGLTLDAGSAGIRLGSGGADKISLYGATPVVQASAITAPSGGVVVDVEARTAIATILAAIGAAAGGIGVTA